MRTDRQTYKYVNSGKTTAQTAGDGHTDKNIYVSKHLTCIQTETGGLAEMRTDRQRRTDRQTNRQTDGRTGRQNRQNRETDRQQTERQTDRRMDGQAERRAGRQKDGQLTDTHTNRQRCQPWQKRAHRQQTTDKRDGLDNSTLYWFETHKEHEEGLLLWPHTNSL